MLWLIPAVLALLGYEGTRAQTQVLKSLSIKTPESAMVEGPLVSIIIPAFNEERYLPSVLAAIQNQTYTPIEIIVVDNMSEDSTVAIAQQYGARVLVNQVPANINMSRNMGFQAAAGDILLFVDADTILQNDLVEECVKSLLAGYDLVYPNKCFTDDNFLNTWRVFAGLVDPGGLTSGGACIAIFRHVLEAVGGWDESLNPLTGRKEDGKTLYADVVAAGFKTTILRSVYAGISGRRELAHGLVPNPTGIWKTRAVRGDETDQQVTKGVM